MMDVYKTLYQIVDNYDYFYKGDDDSFVINENLEFLMQKFNANGKIETGYAMRDQSSPLLYSGGAGYLLSRSALKAIVHDGLEYPNGKPKCDTTEGPEDVRLAACARVVDVAQYDCHDAKGAKLFYNMKLETKFDRFRWLAEKDVKSRPNWDYVSENHATFHYVDGSMQYVLEFVIYFVGHFLKHQLLRDPYNNNGTKMEPKIDCKRLLVNT
ncbi:unnamed protein product [Echinostoma caproni]|uniref:N-acetylgalactosaminide beta-1,3-galactosyltransferase n=1 Tax=Echinostoma caproni TaxID=27848 RepID=A0A183AFV1_9TREM|nr:unnamed protein product [Echinostoma caproni]